MYISSDHNSYCISNTNIRIKHGDVMVGNTASYLLVLGSIIRLSFLSLTKNVFG